MSAPFLTCFGCGHHWHTEAAFIADVQAFAVEVGWTPPTVTDLPFCPLCSHDF